jgi:hypothetical protein
MTEQAEGGTNRNTTKEHQELIEYPIKKAEILRKEAKKTGKDVDTILLGYVLSIILEDDANAFNTTVLSKKYSFKDVEYSRTGILGRLSLEIEFEEIPEKLRKQLELARDELQVHDWKGKEGFNKAHNIWKKTVRDWTLNFRDTNPEMMEAYEKFQSFDVGLSEVYLKKI